MSNMRGSSSLEMGGIGIESDIRERIEKKVSAVRPARIKNGAEHQRKHFFEVGRKNGSSNYAGDGIHEE